MKKIPPTQIGGPFWGLGVPPPIYDKKKGEGPTPKKGISSNAGSGKQKKFPFPPK